MHIYIFWGGEQWLGNLVVPLSDKSFRTVFRKSTADILFHDAGRGLYSLTLLVDFDSITLPESFLLYIIFEFERNLRDI